MKVLEFKLSGDQNQFNRIDDAIRTTKFIRNSCLKTWIDASALPKEERPKFGRFDFNNKTAALAKQFKFADKLNSMARQAAAERAWSSVGRFYDNCKVKKKVKGYPKFQKVCRSVEYKTCGWKISHDGRHIKFTDGHEIGKMKLVGTHGLPQNIRKEIKRVRIVKRASGYYVQLCVEIPNTEFVPLTGKQLGIDLGLNHFYTDSNGATVENPRFYRKMEKELKKAQRAVSKKVKGSGNRKKAVVKLAKVHEKVSNQRKDWSTKLARSVMMSNDIVVVEDLRVANMVKNHCLAKSIHDASWTAFVGRLELFASKFGKSVVRVNPAFTSQACSNCGTIVPKSLKERVHKCDCGCRLDRDHNAALNIMSSGLRKIRSDRPESTLGEIMTTTEPNESSVKQVESKNQEPKEASKISRKRRL